MRPSRFLAEGHAAAQVEAIAADAGLDAEAFVACFGSMDGVLLELHRRLAEAFAEAARLPDGSWQERSLSAIDSSLRPLAPHRDTLRAVFGALSVFEPQGYQYVLSENAKRQLSSRLIRSLP